MFNDIDPYIYIVSITAIATVIYVWISYRVTSFRKRRVERIENLIKKDPETTSAIPTDVLSAKEERQERRDMVKGVKTRFTVIRRTLIISLGVVWSLAMMLPFVGQLPSTMISIIVAVSTAVVGIAARPLVENMISGIVISFSKQLRVGDTLIIDGQYGNVEDISITHTKIKIWDWKRYIIPNSRMLNKEFSNLTLNDSLLWAYVEFSVAYDTDIDMVREIAVDVASRSEHHNEQEDPQFWIRSMDKENIVCWVAAWADSPAEAWNLKSDICMRLIRAFKERGIATHMSQINLAKNNIWGDNTSHE
ncbi:mechanosensitive ion channel family protein [Maridesulfovibrio salexigens]|uniref:MscS Mechanosensitive ion channel n=1 Tax=Maridesulfovibrio salexigens (strain ATCC 14822 / DSM 2638 / NCIMB 8403 / VKM B-1763) TaxID=526222 RepID=C6BW82_MARSD|nr:mechanosensitive ion channel domain-containing protein [Maridesulfovibrio salexigens]ACS78326.1 MscS Mechanosensitive ion channel [Maridesulfovibrio salexigens DSM 2638]